MPQPYYSQPSSPFHLLPVPNHVPAVVLEPTSSSGYAQLQEQQQQQQQQVFETAAGFPPKALGRLVRKDSS